MEQKDRSQREGRLAWRKKKRPQLDTQTMSHAES
jgi:hypothetical protein